MLSTVARKLRFCLLLATLATLAAPLAAGAEPTPLDPPAEMATVTVTDRAEDQLSGMHTLAAETLQQLPRKNGSVAESITILPHVQPGEAQRTSERAGEILPPLISISGARPYENYFAVDGVGLNSLLDPLADNPVHQASIPGHPQRTFLQRSLIDSVTVYDSNVPARYGSFLGGVVDARTRNPAREFGGTVSLRMTQDEWASQHVAGERQDDFTNSADHYRQPAYFKYDGSLTLDIPLNETSGLLAAYSTLRSQIDLQHLGTDRDQDKVLDNYFLKYLWTPASPWSAELTGTYTPSEETFFIKNTRDSDLAIDRGGWSLNGILSRKLAAGEVALSVAYLASENSRSAPNEYKSWKHAPSTNWGQPLGVTFSQEGGYGDLETEEESLQFKLGMTLDPIRVGSVSHTLSYGATYLRDGGDYERTETGIIYNSSVVNPNFADTAWLVCADGDSACIDGEQYFNFRNIYAKARASAVIHRQAYYVEDLLAFGRFTLRPGVRVSHDDFLDNTDLAPRLAGGWDLFGNGGTRLSAGLNRYYGEALLTYKLREAIPPTVRETRTRNAATGTLSPWTQSSVLATTLNRFSELDTPYSDELAIGLDQALYGGKLSLDYLDRRHRRQFARERISETVDGTTRNYYRLNNNGESDYESWSIGWERQWLKHYVNVNYTYTESESSNESYDADLNDAARDERVWFDGDYVLREDLPRTDFHRPHGVNFVYVGKLPWGLTFTNVTKYQSGYEDRDTLSNAEKTALGIPTDVVAYRKDKLSGATIFDWRLDWETATWRDQRLTVSLEVNNVFDRKVKSGGDDAIYELGREFWLGMSYRF